MEMDAIVGIVAAFLAQMIVFAIGYGRVIQKVNDQGEQLRDLRAKVQTSNNYKKEIGETLVGVAQELKGVKEFLGRESERLGEAFKNVSEICRELTDRTARLEGRLDKR